MGRFRAGAAALLTFVIALTGLVLVAPSAEAVGGWTSSSNGVLYANNPQHAYRYSAPIPARAADWVMEVDLIGPDGGQASWDFVWGGRQTGSGNLYIFSSSLPGRYTIRASGEWYDANYDSHAFTVPASTFMMRKAHSKTTLSVSDRTPRKGQTITMKVTIKDERPRGYFKTQYAPVKLQRKVGGTWKTYGWGTGKTSANGTVKFRTKFTGKPTKIRAVAVSDTGDWTRSVSKVISLHR